MYSLNIIKVLSILLLIMFIPSCGDTLEIVPPAELTEDFIMTKNGANAVLNSAYDNIHYNDFAGGMRIYIEESTTDVLLNFRGFLQRRLSQFLNFTFNPATIFLEDQLWDKVYRAIRDVNVFLANIENNVELSEEEKNELIGEAKFIRSLHIHFYIIGLEPFL